MPIIYGNYLIANLLLAVTSKNYWMNYGSEKKLLKDGGKSRDFLYNLLSMFYNSEKAMKIILLVILQKVFMNPFS